jgi:hypothetical protein
LVISRTASNFICSRATINRVGFTETSNDIITSIAFNNIRRIASRQLVRLIRAGNIFNICQLVLGTKAIRRRNISQIYRNTCIAPGRRIRRIIDFIRTGATINRISTNTANDIIIACITR